MKNYIFIICTLLIVCGSILSCKPKQSQVAEEGIISPVPEMVINYESSGIIESSFLFDPGRNTPLIIGYDVALPQVSTRSITPLANENYLLIGEEGDGNYNYQPLLLVYNNVGTRLGKLTISMQQGVKYNLYHSSVVPDTEDGFTMFVMKEMDKNSTSVYEDSDEVKMRSYLRTRQIDKLVFPNSLTGYQTQEMPLTDLLLDDLSGKGLTTMSNVALLSTNNQLIITAEVRRPEDWQDLPYMALVDNNLQLINSMVLEQYNDTRIKNVTMYSSGNLHVEAIESSAADGWYYDRNIRLILDKDLQIIADQSDDEPYWSLYRGPSAPDYTEDTMEEDEDEDLEEILEEPVPADPEDDMTFKHILYRDIDSGIYYRIRCRDFRPEKAIFEKISSADDITLWKIELLIPENYVFRFMGSSKGFETSNGGFAFFIHLFDDNAAVNAKSSILMLVFDKEGRIVQQMQTPEYNTVTEFLMEETQGQLVTFFGTKTFGSINGESVYSDRLRIQTYPLKNK